MTSPTVPEIVARKASGPPIVMVTAYDTPSAQMASEAGVDVILVGDSVSMVVLGYQDTLRVGIDDMAYHVGAVARANPLPLIVGDLPWMSYHIDVPTAVANAARLVKAGAQSVKLEGGRKRVDAVRAIIDAEIPVMGHIGLTPQSVNVMGGFKVQGRDAETADSILADACALADAGCFAMVLEAIPSALAAEITRSIPVPTIGIGAGPGCDGQVLVFHDLLGLQDELRPRYVRRYASLRETAIVALRSYASDVRDRSFPRPEESYGGTDRSGAQARARS